jgi:hypothetical protein
MTARRFAPGDRRVRTPATVAPRFGGGAAAGSSRSRTTTVWRPGARGVEAEPDVERLCKRICRKVVSQIGSDAAGQIPTDRVVVPIEDGREHERFGS